MESKSGSIESNYRFKNQYYPVYINVSDIYDLKSTTLVFRSGVEFGAATTVSSFQSQLAQFIKTRDAAEMHGFKALLDNVKYFAGKQIRNVSAISGNICTASPISSRGNCKPNWSASADAREKWDPTWRA